MAGSDPDLKTARIRDTSPLTFRLSSQDIILLRTYGGAAAWTKGKGPPAIPAPCFMMRWNRGTMKLPYIKVEVEYREEETGAPRKVSPALIVGFGLHWAWVYLFMFNGQYILFPEADSMQLLLSTTSGIFHAVALLLYAVFLKQARTLFDTPTHIRRNRLVAAFLVAGATLLCMAGT